MDLSRVAVRVGVSKNIKHEDHTRPKTRVRRKKRKNNRNQRRVLRGFQRKGQ